MKSLLTQAIDLAFNFVFDFSKAKYHSMKLLDLDKSNAYSNLILGLSMAKLEMKKEALEFLSKASKFNEHSILSFHQSGVIYENLQDYSSAIKSYKKALKIDRNHRDTLVSLSNLLIRLHQYERAVKYLKHAYEKYKDDTEILFGYSLSIFRDYVAFKERDNSGSYDTLRNGKDQQ
jgi:tetratricopeptide (TPR) repeat protein